MTAFLKANWPLVCMTSLINSEAGVGNKEDGYNSKVGEYVEEARAMKLKITSPCVKESDQMCKFVWNKNEIRFGLEMVKKVSRGAVAWILRQPVPGEPPTPRQANSLKEFILSGYEYRQVESTKHEKDGQLLVGGGQQEWRSFTKIGKTDLEYLVYSGALDVYGIDRSKMLVMLPTLQKLSEKYHDQVCKVRNGVNVRLTPEAIKAELDAFDLTDEDVDPRMTWEEQLDKEREVTGCYLSESPFAPFRHVEDKYCNTTIGDILDNEDGCTRGDTFLGVVSKSRTQICKNGRSKGQEMAFLGFTGTAGSIEGACFAENWAAIDCSPDASHARATIPSSHLASGAVQNSNRTDRHYAGRRRDG